jgi:hypothetical protein
MPKFFHALSLPFGLSLHFGQVCLIPDLLTFQPIVSIFAFKIIRYGFNIRLFYPFLPFAFIANKNRVTFPATN